MSSIENSLTNRPGKTSACYDSIWERLPDALNRIITQTGMSEDEAQKALCRAIGDGAVGIRCKLGNHTTKLLCASDTILGGADFSMPVEINPEDMDWERSRPSKPWAVRREAYRTAGYWVLDWIEISKPDVTNAFGTRRQDDLARSARGVGGQMKKPSLAKERALEIIKELFPGGVPDPVILPNVHLCEQVGDQLQKKKLPNVSYDTVLRAAGRRK